MTHSTGISVTEELSVAFAGGRAEHRAIKVVIRDFERLVPDGTLTASGSEVEDFANIRQFMVPKQPCYVLYRLDEMNANNQQGWLFIAYSPDGSSVKDRMIYAGTRESMKRELGFSQFKDELFGTEPNEFSWEMYQDHVSRSHDVSSVLTESERMSAAESQMAVAQGPSKEYVHSVKFPISTEAVAQLQAFVAGSVTFVQLRVDTSKETIELGEHGNYGPDDLVQHVPANEPRFNLVKWNDEINVFIYSCPDGAKIKDKMLYSTVKAVAVGAIEGEKIQIHKKLECQDPSKELTREAMTPDVEAADEAASDASPATTTFAKPTRAGKGGRRLIRTQK